jgi:16S rRNA (guanine(966)-N(2))-methyltransferase RsmD
MRVIAGTYRSRLLAAPRGTGTRPTSDRLRETLFNVLAPRLPGARFADLYAGTGAVGIEALSRGAAHVFFAENAAPALASIRANLASLKIVRGFDLEERGTGALLERLAKAALRTPPPAPLDLVYLDPPWETEAEYTATLQLLGSARGAQALAPAALVVAEHISKKPLPERFGTLSQTRTLKQGDAALTWFAQSAIVL